MRGLILHIAGLALAGALVALVGGASASAATQDSFQPVGNLVHDRDGAQVTRLADGTVLVTGGNHCVGSDCTVVASAELFDPKTNQFTAVGPMTSPRDDSHRAVLLKDGRVLIAGGSPDYHTEVRAAEIYDPSTRVFASTGNMIELRAGHTASLLPDGRVLLAGGWNSGEGGPTATAELFDPATGKFRNTASMAARRYRHAAVSLTDGRVVILGGYDPNNRTLTSVEIYDPTTGTFSKQGNLVQARGNMTADLLPDGRILVTGGMDTGTNANGWDALNSVEIYDPATGKSAITGTMTDPRGFHVASPLPDGRILVAGGWNGSASVRSADVIDPTTGKVSPTAPMTVARQAQTGVALLDGRVLILGGDGTDGTSSLATAEVFVPGTPSASPSP